MPKFKPIPYSHKINASTQLKSHNQINIGFLIFDSPWSSHLSIYPSHQMTCRHLCTQSEHQSHPRALLLWLNPLISMNPARDTLSVTAIIWPTVIFYYIYQNMRIQHDQCIEKHMINVLNYMQLQVIFVILNMQWTITKMPHIWHKVMVVLKIQ